MEEMPVPLSLPITTPASSSATQSEEILQGSLGKGGFLSGTWSGSEGGKKGVELEANGWLCVGGTGFVLAL